MEFFEKIGCECSNISSKNSTIKTTCFLFNNRKFKPIMTSQKELQTMCPALA